MSDRAMLCFFVVIFACAFSGYHFNGEPPQVVTPETLTAPSLKELKGIGLKQAFERIDGPRFGEGRLLNFVEPRKRYARDNQ